MVGEEPVRQEAPRAAVLRGPRHVAGPRRLAQRLGIHAQEARGLVQIQEGGVDAAHCYPCGSSLSLM